MAKPKYSLETRLAVVSHYLSGNDGTQRTAQLFGVERTSARRWVRAWQLHGIDGITWKNDRYSPAFRIAVSRQTVYDWIERGEIVMSGSKIDVAATERQPQPAESTEEIKPLMLLCGLTECRNSHGRNTGRKSRGATVNILHLTMMMI